MSTFNRNDFLYDKQFGFHKEYNTQRVVAFLSDDITQVLDIGESNVGVFYIFLKLLTQFLMV